MLEGMDALITSMMWAVIILVGIWILGQLVALISGGR